MTITLDLPEDTLAALRAEAQARGRSAEDVAAEHLTDWYAEEDDIDADTIAAIEQGFADLEAGRSFSLAEVRALTDAVLKTHPGKGAP